MDINLTQEQINDASVTKYPSVTTPNNGKIKRVATNTYIIIPSNVDLTGDDLLDELENSGVYF